MTRSPRCPEYFLRLHTTSLPWRRELARRLADPRLPGHRRPTPRREICQREVSEYLHISLSLSLSVSLSLSLSSLPHRSYDVLCLRFPKRYPG